MIKTNWVVITGAPCSGKTSLLNKIREYGYRYVPEIARVYTEAQLRIGRTLEQIRGDEGAFQRALMLPKLEIERGLSPTELVFLDRACPDSLSYYRVAGIPVDTISGVMNERIYAKVFLFERLPMGPDIARNEFDEQRELIERYLFEDYSALGYDVMRVPVMPMEARISYVLTRMPGC